MTKSPRRLHDATFKTKVVLEALKGAKTLAQLSTEFGIHAQQITERSGVPVEEAGTRRPTLTLQLLYGQTTVLPATARRYRKPSLSTDLATKGRKRLAQKKLRTS